MLRGGFEQSSSSASEEASGSKGKEVCQVNDSLFELHKPEGTPSVEIILFHGLHLGESSDAHLSTWKVEDGSIWPQKWLVEEYPSAHIFTVSYSAGVAKTSNENFDMYIIVENLISDLMHANIGQTAYCPVVLVGHCFGGLVIKQLCLESSKPIKNWDEDEMAKPQTFLKKLRGVFFYGTPHRGSPLISPHSDDSNSPLLKYFKILSKEAARLNFEFEHLRKIYIKWRIAGLGESRPTESGLFQDVVAASEASSRGGDLYNVVAADHISISRPSSKRDMRFYSFTGLLKTIAKISEGEAKEREETAVQDSRPHNFQWLPEPMVNIDADVDQITSKLKTVRTLGLAGMGGLGKTTLAMAIFDKLGPRFKYTCFVKDVKLIPGSANKVKDAVWGSLHCFGKKVRGEQQFSILRGKKLLLVLDDVSYRDDEILRHLVNDSGSESRFIVTSRDQNLLSTLDSNRAEVYPVHFLNQNSAKVLFIKCAFPMEAGPPIELESLLEAIVKKCDGLPLTLNVVGSYLRERRNCDQWNQTLNALIEAEGVTGLNERLWEKLRFSYSGLKATEQQMFLDVCTFFGNNENWTLYEAKLAWRAVYETTCENLLWQTLVDVSLVYNVKEDENIKVHEQLQSLGRKIASEPAKNNKCRIWDGEVALKILQSDAKSEGKGIHALRLVDVQHPQVRDSEKIRIQGTGLQELTQAKFLEADIEITTTRVLAGVCNTILRKFCIRANENASMSTKLVLLKCIGVDLLKLALDTSLVVLRLSHVKNLPQSFGNLNLLQCLVFTFCSRLETLPASFGHLANLNHLEFHYCWKLQSLPDSFGHLATLNHLQFHDCIKLQTLPDSFGHLATLKHLEFHYCDQLQTLPDSFGHLASLNHLEFHYCDQLQRLPDSFGHLATLNHLQFHHCWLLETLPDSFGHLATLNHLQFHYCDQLQRLPDSFGHLATLNHLQFHYCSKLQSLPDSFGHLATLNHLQFHFCGELQTLPDSFGQLATLNHLHFCSCPKLRISPESSLNTMFHNCIRCDVCKMCPIAGTRFKSIRKHDYDLCSNCFKEADDQADYTHMERPLFRPCDLHSIPHPGGS